MTPGRLQELLDAYGADPARWPPDERDTALALIKRSPAVRAQAERDAVFDAMLNRWRDPPVPTIDARALTAQITGTAQRVVQQRAGRRWPVLGWPNAMGLAAAALAGFLIGWSGLDSTLLPTHANGAETSAVALVIEDATW